MVKSDLLKLIKKGENRKVDFKREFYHFPEKKFEFIKDISAMANSTLKGDDDSLILVGYKENDAFYDVDISKIKEAELQELMAANVSPKVNFFLEPITIKHENITYNLLIIKIPVSTRKPHIINKNFPNSNPKLYEGQCFVRNGSSTSKSNRHELAEMIYDADGNPDRTKKLIDYILSMNKINQQLDKEEIYKLLDYDLIPTFSIDFTKSLNVITDNANGDTIEQYHVTKADEEKDIKLFEVLKNSINNYDYLLAETLLNKISNIEAYYSTCLSAVIIHTHLDNKDKVLKFFNRAKELNPNDCEIYLRYAMYFLNNKKNGDALLHLEKAYDLVNTSTNLQIQLVIIHNLFWIYKEMNVKKRMDFFLKKYLELEKLSV